MSATILWSGKPTYSYLARVVVATDEEDPTRIVLAVEQCELDALGAQSWRPVSDQRRAATIEAALLAAHNIPNKDEQP